MANCPSYQVFYTSYTPLVGGFEGPPGSPRRRQATTVDRRTGGRIRAGHVLTADAASSLLSSVYVDPPTSPMTSLRSSSVSSQPTLLALAIAWPGRATPAMTQLTAGNDNSQPKASSTRVWPRSMA
jgi:hypothetical protein